MSVQIWFELYRPPTKDDKDLLETVLESWFLIGRLGGFNGMNMQVRWGGGPPPPPPGQLGYW